MAKLCTAIAAALIAAAPVIALAQQSAPASVPTIPAQSPAAHDPGVNPSAAGIQAGDVGSAGVRTSAGGGHSGSQRLSTNTQPFAAAKASHQRRWKQREQQILRRAIGSSGQKHQTSGNAAGR